MIRITGIKLGLDETDIKPKVTKLLRISIDEIIFCTIVKKAVDARRKQDVHYVCSVDVLVDDEDRILKRSGCKQARIVVETEYTFPKTEQLKQRPIVVGAGPAGLFCTLMLAQAGHRPILIERGADVNTRIKDVNKFWKSGVFNPNSNVQFGEGGAGTFSDGKLTTGIKDIRCRYVLQQFVRFGAIDDILSLAKPHIGTDKLCKIVENIRNRSIECGGEVWFNTYMTDIIIKDNKVTGVKIIKDGEEKTITSNKVVLAIGHSARDTFEMLKKNNIHMERKPFSVGGRIEHLQEAINKSQYGDFHEKLGAADYKLSVHLPNGRSAYTFCMCPGGVVVAAASQEGHVVTNGMSDYSRDGVNANSALLVEVSPQDFDGDDVLAGMYFQKEIERKAFIVGGENYNAPSQKIGDFLDGAESESTGTVSPTYKPGVKLTNIESILPDFVVQSMKDAIVLMDKQLAGFANPDAILTVPETRSSSPVRILRNETKQASIKGLYPCGEGAGYAGGIMSAAVDGIRVATAVVGIQE